MTSKYIFKILNHLLAFHVKEPMNQRSLAILMTSRDKQDKQMRLLNLFEIGTQGTSFTTEVLCVNVISAESLFSEHVYQLANVQKLISSTFSSHNGTCAILPMSWTPYHSEVLTSKPEDVFQQHQSVFILEKDS